MDASRHDTTGCTIKKRSNDLFFKNRYLYLSRSSSEPISMSLEEISTETINPRKL